MSTGGNVEESLEEVYDKGRRQGIKAVMSTAPASMNIHRRRATRFLRGFRESMMVGNSMVLKRGGHGFSISALEVLRLR